MVGPMVDRNSGPRTDHKVLFADAGDMGVVPSQSVELVVTSPPYPMIEMWDECFAEQDSEIQPGSGWPAFKRMHAVLDRIWSEVHRILVPGGIACVNIGDATRTIKGTFILYPNHMRVLSQLVRLGFNPLPAILWRKQTSAPNKFMGSGMMPPGAYVTLEHEYVLIVRKGDKRIFGQEQDRVRRCESAFFWEERNNWFSDVWFDLKGTGQEMLEGKARGRSGAFPFDLAYRLISMFSIKGDTILDPFLGTGTTMLAAMAATRNSIGFERDENLKTEFVTRTKEIVAAANTRIQERLESHVRFVRERFKTHGRFGYQNRHYGFPVVTRQETSLFLNPLLGVRGGEGDTFNAEHGMMSEVDQEDWAWFFSAAEAERPLRRRRAANPEALQLNLFHDQAADGN